MSLMTAREIIDEVLPAKNMDEALLQDNIELAELKYIKRNLGDTYYAQLQSEVLAQTFTGLNEDLLVDHIKPTLARYVVYEALPMMKAEITANGIQMPRTDMSDPVNETSYAGLRNKLMSDAELLMAELMDFVKEQRSSFPTIKHYTPDSDHNLPFLY